MTSKLTRDIIQSEIADFFAGVVEIHTELGGPNTVEEAQDQLTERVLACVPGGDSEPAHEATSWQVEEAIANMESENDTVVVPRGLLGAASGAIRHPRHEAGVVLGALRHYCFRRKPAQPAPVVMPDTWPRKLIWSHHDDIAQAEVLGWNNAIDACRAAILQAQSVCTCPSGDGSLLWPCPSHPGNSPVIPGSEQRIADAVELLKQAAPAMLAENSGPDGPLVGRMKSPAIPDGYVMVPKEPTEDMIAAAMNCDDVLFNSDESFCVQFGNIYEAMLAAAPTGIPMNSNGWVPVSERMPEKNGMYQVWNGKHMAAHSFFFGSFQCINPEQITHWMPLPAAPQEVKGE